MLQEDMVPRLTSDRRFLLILLAVQSMNEMFRFLYRGGVWLDKAMASKISGLGLKALRCYHELASIHVEMRLPRFPVHPKFHMLYHTFRFVELSGERNMWTESPAVDMCSQDESFVGIVSRWSRRVSNGATIDRTWDLYLACLHERWQR